MNKSAQRGQRKWKGPEKSPDHKTVAKNGCITTVAKYTEKERKYLRRVCERVENHENNWKRRQRTRILQEQTENKLFGGENMTND